MPIDIGGTQYLITAEVLDGLKVSRQTLWRWRQQGKIPAGHRYRGREVVFSPAEVAAIREFANRVEPIEPGQNTQLGLFNSR
jgi:hypothetical protein